MPPAGAAPSTARRHRAGLLLVGGTGALVLMGAVLQTFTGEFAKIGLVASPQRYVALDLLDPGVLPPRLGPGSSLAFGFQVDNATGRALSQPWQVALVTTKGAIEVIEAGTAHVGPGQVATVRVSVRVPSPARAASVEVIAPGAGVAPLSFHISASGAQQR